MSKDIKIKASGIDNLTDGRFFAAAGVEWVGFPADFSQEKSLTKVQILEIKGWLYGPRYVLETGNLGEDEINDLCKFTGIYNVQTARKVDGAELNDVQSIIRELTINPQSDWSEVQASISAEQNSTAQFLLKMQGSLAHWEHWSKNEAAKSHLLEIINTSPIILEMDFDQGNVVHLIEEFQPFGISIKGSGEQEVGLKTFDEIADIFDRLEM